MQMLDDVADFDPKAYGVEDIEQKAGIVLWGIENGKVKVVAPYVVGRFGTGQYYTIGKGTVDTEKGESLWEGAKREFLEETGIDVNTLIKERDIYSNTKKKKRDESAPRLHEEETCTSKKAPENKKKGRKRVFESYARSSRDNPKHQTIYALRVENIGALEEHCKNHGQKARPLEKEVVAKGGHDFKNLMKGLCGLHVFRPLFKQVVEWDEDLPDSFDELAEMIAKEIAERDVQPFDGEKSLFNPAYFDYLYEHATMRERNKIKDMATVLKDTIIKKYPDLLSDNAPYKMDTKGMPLRYYQECATVMDYGRYLRQMKSDCERAAVADGVIGSYYNAHMGNIVAVEGKRGDEDVVYQRISSQLDVLHEIYEEVTKGLMNGKTVQSGVSVKTGRLSGLEKALQEIHPPAHKELAGISR